MGSRNTYPATESCNRVLQQSPTKRRSDYFHNNILFGAAVYYPISHVGHDSSTCGTCLIQVNWLNLGHDSFTFGTWRIHMWDMTHSHVGHDESHGTHDSFTCGTCLIQVKWLNPHLGHDEFTCGTWHIHMSDMINHTGYKTHSQRSNTVVSFPAYVPQKSSWKIKFKSQPYSQFSQYFQQQVDSCVRNVRSKCTDTADFENMNVELTFENSLDCRADFWEDFWEFSKVSSTVMFSKSVLQVLFWSYVQQQADFWESLPGVFWIRAQDRVGIPCRDERSS